MLARSRLSATGTACVPPLTSLCYPPTIIRAFCVCGPHVMRSSKTNHKPADMQQAYLEANTELVEQVSKMTSKHEKEREREESDKRTNEKADRCVCCDVLVAHLLHGLLALFARPSPHCLRLGLAWRALSSDASAHRAVWVRRLHRADMCGLAVSTNVGAWVLSGL